MLVYVGHSPGKWVATASAVLQNDSRGKFLSEKRRAVINDYRVALFQWRDIRKSPILQKFRLSRPYEFQRLGILAASQCHRARVVLDCLNDALSLARSRRTRLTLNRREPENCAEREQPEARGSRDKSSLRVHGDSFHFGREGMASRGVLASNASSSA